MAIIATFKNGHKDVYKGKRPVKAAWAIIDRESGEVLCSGHSLDREKALKTAEGNCQFKGGRPGDPMAITMGPQSKKWPPFIKHAAEWGRKAGWDGKGSVIKWWEARNAEVRALRRSRVTIEIIDL